MKRNLLTLDILLAKEIKYMLKEDHYAPGDRLPSERELCERFQVQRLTIRSALSQLLQDGTIMVRPRSGYYVAPKKITLFTQDYSMNYVSPVTGKPLDQLLYDFKKMKPDLYLSSKMLLSTDTFIYKLVTLYTDEKVPVCISQSHFPEYIDPNLSLSLVRSASLCDLFTRNHQIAIAKSNQKITIVYADETQAELLGISPGDPLIKYQGLMYDTQGRLVNFFENFMLIDRFSFIKEAAL